MSFLHRLPKGQFFCRFTLFFHWKDEKNIGIEKGTYVGVKCCGEDSNVVQRQLQRQEKEVAQSFSPLIRFRDGSDIAFDEDQALQPVTMDDRGNTKLIVSCSGVFDQEFRLRDFPFDMQSLHINVRFPHPVDRMQLVPLAMSLDHLTSVVFDEHFSLTEWACLRPYIKVRYEAKTKFGRKENPKPSIAIVLPVKRAYGHYILHICSIAFVVTSSCGAAFVLPASDLSDRLGIILTLFLTIVATKFLVGDKLPSVAFITYLDAYFLWCFFFFVFLIVEMAVMTWQVPFGDATTIDRIIAAVWAGSWLSFNIFAIIRVSCVLRKQDGDHIRNAWIPAGESQEYAQRADRVKEKHWFYFFVF